MAFFKATVLRPKAMPDPRDRNLAMPKDADLMAIDSVIQTRAVLFVSAPPPGHTPPCVKTVVQMPIGETWVAEDPATVIRRLREAEANILDVDKQTEAEAGYKPVPLPAGPKVVN